MHEIHLDCMKDNSNVLVVQQMDVEHDMKSCIKHVNKLEIVKPSKCCVELRLQIANLLAMIST